MLRCVRIASRHREDGAPLPRGTLHAGEVGGRQAHVHGEGDAHPPRRGVHRATITPRIGVRRVVDRSSWVSHECQEGSDKAPMAEVPRTRTSVTASLSQTPPVDTPPQRLLGGHPTDWVQVGLASPDSLDGVSVHTGTWQLYKEGPRLATGCQRIPRCRLPVKPRSVADRHAPEAEAEPAANRRAGCASDRPRPRRNSAPGVGSSEPPGVDPQQGRCSGLPLAAADQPDVQRGRGEAIATHSAAAADTPQAENWKTKKSTW